MRLYISGPISGVDQFNRPAFEEAARVLRGMGHVVVSPIEMDDEDGGPSEHVPWEEYLKRDVAELVKCDGVVLLENWWESRGATFEAMVARKLGIPLYLWSHIVAVDAPDVAQLNPHWAERVWGVPLDSEIEFYEDETRQFGGLEDDPFDLGERDPGYPDPDDGEVRTTSSTGGQKGVKLARFDLLPAGVLWEIAEHFGRGARKYADRNWERGYEWSKSFGALMRHAWAWWGGEELDQDTGSHHLAAVGFHALVLLTFKDEQPDFDDRPIERTQYVDLSLFQEEDGARPETTPRP